MPAATRILGHVAGHIGCRAVDLRRILAGEAAPTVACYATVGVDDDLAAGQACVPRRATGNEAARSIDQEIRVRVQVFLRNHGPNNVLDDVSLDLGVGHIRGDAGLR